MDTIISHFVRLGHTLVPSFNINDPICTSIDGLSHILCCTPRNVKFILRRLEEMRLIQWLPGRGRGHTSQLIFLRSVDEVLEEYFQELMNKGKIKEAVEMIGTPEVIEPLKDRLLAELNKQMGFHSEPYTASGLDVLRMMRNRRMEKLDPAFVYTAFESYLLGQLCNTLVTYDAVQHTFLPALAHMWECNEDQTQWVFYLRKGVQFHHGRVMTSKDVKETLQRLIDLKSPALWHYQDIARTEIQGDYCIRFFLKRPNHFFLHLFSCIHMSIIPYDVDVSVKMIGTGPYRIRTINEDVLVLAAFDHYFAIRPLLDQVDIWFVPEQSSNERKYELTDTGDSKHSSNNIDYPALGCRYMLFNFRKEGVHHKILFRQVLRILYNQMALVRELKGNRITPADSFLPWKSSQRIWDEPSVEQAKELLSSSVYNGEIITIAFMGKKEEREDAEWLQQRAALIGLRIDLCPMTKFNINEVISNAELLICEEVLEDDWQWGMINYFKNESNYLYSLLLESQRDLLDSELEGFMQLTERGRVEVLEHAEQVLRDNCWVMHGSHINKSAQLNQSIFGLQTGSFGFMDISKLWIKTPAK